MLNQASKKYPSIVFIQVIFANPLLVEDKSYGCIMKLRYITCCSQFSFMWNGLLNRIGFEWSRIRISMGIPYFILSRKAWAFRWTHINPDRTMFLSCSSQTATHNLHCLVSPLDISPSGLSNDREPAVEARMQTVSC